GATSRAAVWLRRIARRQRGADAGLVLGLLGHHRTDDVDEGARRRRRHPAAAAHETDGAAGEAVDADHVPSTGEPAGRRRRWEERGAETLEGERRDEAHPVDLRLRLQGHAREAGLRVDVVAE